LYRAGPERPPSLEQARAAEIPPLPQRGVSEEEKLVGIVMRALEKDIAQRYQTARDMLRDLDEYLDSAGMLVSPIRFGDWMTMTFGTEIIEVRRMRERAAKAIEAGPLLELSVRRPAEPRKADPPEAPPQHGGMMIEAPASETPPSLVRSLVKRDLRSTASAYLGMVVLVVLLAVWLFR
jgi:hypothetical protein